MAAGATVGGGGGRKGGLPQSAAMMNLLTDMAFNLLIFFVVLADPTGETGRPMQMPAATEEQANQEFTAELRIELADPDKTNNTVRLNGDTVPLTELVSKLAPLLEAKTKPDDRVVVVSSAKDTPYRWWIAATSRIEQAGGVVALQVDEEQEVTVPSPDQGKPAGRGKK